jgi:shikimate dehydrogenase
MKRFYVIGDPIAHSLSPAMHSAALKVLGLPHTYEAMQVSAERLPSVLDRVRRGEIHGLNVTVPHKVEAMHLCDHLTDEVTATGAVNTVFLDHTGRLIGTNTDCDGLRADLIANGLEPKTALVLGTGGAARAAIVALRRMGARIAVAGRRQASAHLLARELGCDAVPWDALGGPYDLIVNATSAGMSGGEDGSAIAEAWSRAKSAAAYDLVYRPGVTPFLERAAADGARAINGLGMLVEQGARALSIFLGQPIGKDARDAMRSAVTSARPTSR